MLAAILGCARVAGSSSAHAQQASIVIEIDQAAEQLLDARTARRLVLLELSEVQVPAGALGVAPALFYRVLGGADGALRVELWERGELHDARVISASQGSGQLIARRVALAAAELARVLRQRRIARERRDARERQLREAEARKRARQTREGPIALRSSFGVARLESLTLAGPAVTAELSAHGRLRFDVGARWMLDLERSDALRVTWLEVPIAVARRIPLARSLELDASAFVAPAIVHVAGALAVDDVRGVRETGSARGGVALRLEPRITRSLRATVGADASVLLRSVSVRRPDGSSARYDGVWLGVELGVVLTP